MEGSRARDDQATGGAALLEPQLSFVTGARVAHLSTASAQAVPHVVPVCFALQGGQTVYVSLDLKPKRVGPLDLRRVRNVLDNPPVALVVDRYDELWSRLAYVLIHGRGRLVADAEERRVAVEALRDKYPQYASMPIADRPLLAIDVDRVTSWGSF